VSKRQPSSSKDAARDIDSYLAGVPEPARTTLEKVRKAIKAAAPDASEAISYKIPTFKYKGRPLIYFAAFKDHCSIFPMNDEAWTELKDQLQALNARKTGPGTLQFPVDKPLPAALVKKIVKILMKGIEA
jgi:uncharacterized protein YdhG (YjbR/CyaY superfamily)